MAYQDLYRLSVHAAIFNEKNELLLVKTTYGAKGWTFPGGAIDPGETIHETLIRECREELSVEIESKYLSGVYFHAAHNSHAFVFRCELKSAADIRLSDEHSEYRYFPITELKDSHRVKAEQCLAYKGETVSGKF